MNVGKSKEWLAERVEILNHVAERLTFYRKNKGYSRTYVADCLGISLTAYARYERPTEDIHITKLCRLAALYNIGVADFLPPKPLRIIQPS